MRMEELDMNRPCLRLLSSALMFASGLFSASLAEAGREKAVVAPIDSLPEGQTYGRWAAQWEEWVVGVPAAENPLTDTTGQYCGQRQVDRVWFLAGTFGPGTAVRACDI